MIESVPRGGPSDSDQMWAFDERVRCEGYDVIAGVDEVGRGCLAGPVVAAAVILPRDFQDGRIRDSKQLTARMRETLFDIITSGSMSYGIGVVPPETVDSINILRAALLAMVRAIEKLSQRPDIVLVDELDVRYPGYGFSGNKGYGSKAHVAFLEEHGPCPVHRKSFAPVRRAAELNPEMTGSDVKGSGQSGTLNLTFET